jgi:hypothetical protein
LDWDINLTRLWSVGLGQRYKPQRKTPADRIGTSTRASANSARSDWDIDTSHHNPRHGLENKREREREREKKREKNILSEAANAEGSLHAGIDIAFKKV